jgi:hypothetical protein
MRRIKDNKVLKYSYLTSTERVYTFGGTGARQILRTATIVCRNAGQRGWLIPSAWSANRKFGIRYGVAADTPAFIHWQAEGGRNFANGM